VAEQMMLSLPIQFLVATIAALINERMARQLEYAREEVRALKETLTVMGSERIRFTSEQRRRFLLRQRSSSFFPDQHSVSRPSSKAGRLAIRTS
jgi:hypothetical protein